MNRTIRLLTLAAAISTLTSCDMLDSSNEPVSDLNGLGLYYPLAVGNEWNYHGTTLVGDRTVRVVAREDDGRYRVEYDHKGGADTRWVRHITTSSDRVALQLTETETALSDTLDTLRAPLVPGASWMENPRFGRFEYTVRTVDTTVTVLAGTFDGVVVIDGRFHNNVLPGTSHSVEYYAPRVGLIMSGYSPALGGASASELTSYRIR